MPIANMMTPKTARSVKSFNNIPSKFCGFNFFGLSFLVVPNGGGHAVSKLWSLCILF